MVYKFDKTGRSYPCSNVFAQVRDKMTHATYARLFKILEGK